MMRTTENMTSAQKIMSLLPNLTSSELQALSDSIDIHRKYDKMCALARSLHVTIGGRSLIDEHTAYKVVGSDDMYIDLLTNELMITAGHHIKDTINIASTASIQDSCYRNPEYVEMLTKRMMNIIASYNIRKVIDDDDDDEDDAEGIRKCIR